MKMLTRGLALVAILIAVAIGLVSGSDAAGRSIAVSIKTAHKSGVSARATLKSQGDATIVAVVVTGGDGKQYLPDVRSGTCARPAQAPEIPLAMASSEAASSTTIDVPLTELQDGSYVIMLHRLDGGAVSLTPKTAAACGPIGSSQADESIANAAPETGVGPIGGRTNLRWLTFALASVAGLSAAIAWRIQQRGGGR